MDDPKLSIYMDYWEDNQVVIVIFRNKKAICTIDDTHENGLKRLKEEIDKIFKVA